MLQTLKRPVIHYSLCFILLTFLYACLATQVPLNSDAAATLLEAKDIASGNITLQDWYLSTVSFYFTETLPYAILIKLFGWHLSFAYLVPAIMLSTVVFLAAHLIIRHSRHYQLSRVFPLVVFAAPGFFASHMMLVPCIHMGSYVLTLSCWWLVETYEEHRGAWRLALLTFFLTLTLFSDDIVRYVLLLPLVLTALFKVRQHPHLGWIVLCSILSLALTKLLGFGLTLVPSFETPGLPPLNFTSYNAISYNLELFLKGVLAFFGAEFFGYPIFSWHGLSRLFHAGIALAFFGMLYWIARYRHIRDTLSIGSLLGISIILGAYLLSNLPIDLMTTRYLVPVFILGALVLGRHFPLAGWAYGLSACLALLYAATNIGLPKWDYTTTNRNFPLAQALNQHGLNNGYATFWNANLNALVSRAEISPVIIDSSGIRYFDWLAKSNWKKNGGNFLICDSEEQAGLAISHLGEPNKKYVIDGKILLIWEASFNLN
ncbi:hypothetical protein EC839_106296 [Pseudomonas sp. JUb52]|nr:hypothetical protein EC839_106296 [Pseudomonas sp. JUb52]